MKKSIKQSVAALTAASLVLAPTQRAEAMPLALGICIGVASAGAIAGVAIIVRSCRTPHYCLWDRENQLKVVMKITRRNAALGGYDVICGPFDDAKAAENACVTNIFVPPHVITAYIDPPFYIEKSTNGVNWTVAADLTGQDPEDFQWGETNRLDRSCIYRTKVVQATR